MTQKFNNYFSAYPVRAVNATVPNITGPLAGTTNRYELLPLFTFTVDADTESEVTPILDNFINDCRTGMRSLIGGVGGGTTVIEMHTHMADGGTVLE